MSPFWSMGETMSQVTTISVEDTTITVALSGGLTGAKNGGIAFKKS